MRSVLSLLLLSSCSASTCEQDASSLLQSQRLVRKQSTTRDAYKLLAAVQNVAKSFTEGSEVSMESDDVNTALGETSTALQTMLPMFAAQHAAAQQEINHAIGAIEACQSQHGGELGARLVLAATGALAAKEQCEESLQQAVHAEAEACEGQADDPDCLCTEARTAITQQGDLCAANTETYEVTFCEHAAVCNMLHSCHAQEVEVYNAVRVDVEAAMDARQQQYRAVRQAECITDLITAAMLPPVTPIPHASLVGCSGASIDGLTIAFPEPPPAPTGCLEPQGGPQCDTANVFFHNAVGSTHVIGHFEADETVTGEGGHFLERMQCASNVVRAHVQGGSCGDATVQFRINDATASYFGSGSQAHWQQLAEVVVVSGDVANVPEQIWTGHGAGNKGWIIGRQGTVGLTFASSYNPNAAWDYCNSNALTGSESVSLQCVANVARPAGEFFHKMIGSAHVGKHFETDVIEREDFGYYHERMHCASRVLRVHVQGGSCGDATVQFRINDATANYFGSGSQAHWQQLAEVVVVSGDVANVPEQIWTGHGASNKGWIIGRQGTVGLTFASSYDPNAAWDYCNSNALTGSETVSLQCVGS